jgi:hypothetical protein
MFSATLHQARNLTDFVFGEDASYLGVAVDATPDVLHCIIGEVYIGGCFRHNALCSKETHTVVSRRMAERLGVRVVVLQDASICLPFVADCTCTSNILAGSLDRNSLIIHRHGTPDTLFAVRFKIFHPRRDTFLDNMCSFSGR